mgnify:CR=1 FL=1
MVLLALVLEVLRDPAQEQPQRPAITEVDDSDRRHAPDQRQNRARRQYRAACLKWQYEFLEQLTSNQFKQIEKFFETMPKLSHTVKVKNPNTEVESEVVLEGLSSFFA